VTFEARRREASGFIFFAYCSLARLLKSTARRVAKEYRFLTALLRLVVSG
jgi:hypothetical protein